MFVEVQLLGFSATCICVSIQIPCRALTACRSQVRMNVFILLFQRDVLPKSPWLPGGTPVSVAPSSDLPPLHTQGSVPA